MKPKKRKARIGRPPKENPRNEILTLRLSLRDAKAIRRMAAQAKVTVSTFILRRLLGGK